MEESIKYHVTQNERYFFNSPTTSRLYTTAVSRLKNDVQREQSKSHKKELSGTKEVCERFSINEMESRYVKLINEMKLNKRRVVARHLQIH